MLRRRQASQSNHEGEAGSDSGPALIPDVSQLFGSPQQNTYGQAGIMSHSESSSPNELSVRPLGNDADLDEDRVVPGHSDLSPSTVDAEAGAADVRNLSYEKSPNLNEITRRQMLEDIKAYRFDLDFCRNHLASSNNLTPQEMRTLQIRILDCGHNIRHCQHRIETLDAQAHLNGNGVPHHHGYGAVVPARPSHEPNRNASSGVKRQRMSQKLDVDDEDDKDETVVVGGTGDHSPSLGNKQTSGVGSRNSTSIQRLGFWKCRLCTSQKFLHASGNRVPSMPCKWPLKDVSKMLNHYLDMHIEHLPEERCRELGNALAQNRGPFEYWLTHTRQQQLDDDYVIDEYVGTLQAGSLPEALRSLNRAAGVFPNTVAGAYHQK